MNKIDRMNDLIKELNRLTKLYDEGHPEVDDKTWDNMYFELQQLEEETGITLSLSPTVHIDYMVVNQLKKVEHNHPMLSLDKTKSIDDVVNFAGSKEIIAMAKMDGLTCSIMYEDGVPVSAETRGNGRIGEDILQNIVFAKGVPIEIPDKKKCVVDGEIICTYEDFEDFADTYKNPRNFASGSIRLLDSRASAKRRLTFVAWDCITGMEECDTLNEKLLKLDDLGFIIVPAVVVPDNNLETVQHLIYLIKESAKDFSYPIDGIVFKYNNCNYYQSLGATEHHFRGGLAYKFYDEEYDTKLRDIEWSMGKTGQLTPVAIFDSVDDGESVFNRASLHNLNIVKQTLGCPYYGQNIKVYKANMIIPQVKSGILSEDIVEFEHPDCPYSMTNPWIFMVPTQCPVCGAPTEVHDDILYCSNPNCEGKLLNHLDHFVGKKGLDIKGLSKATLQKLIDWGWVGNLIEIFSLSNFKDEWMEQPGFGEKSVNNILNAIEEARHCELWQFISALSIPLIGTTYAKEIAKREAGWLQFMEDIGPHMLGKGYDFTQWDGFGYEINDSLHNFNYTEANELVATVMDLHNSLFIKPGDVKTTSLGGAVFVITGSLNTFKNRDEAKAKIEALGGKVTSSVSKNTDYLVNNDINSTSSKNIKAKQLGIPIISEDDLIAML